MQPFHCDLRVPNSRSAKNYTDMNGQSLQNTMVEPITRPGMAAAAAAARTKYLSSSAAMTLHGKDTRFRAPDSSQNEAHATSKQPLQCIKQHHVFHPHLSTRMVRHNSNIHAAIPLRSACYRFKKRKSSNNFAPWIGGILDR